MIEKTRIKALIKTAEEVAGRLSRFATPGTGEPVDPSRVAEVMRNLTAHRDIDQARRALQLLPGSFHAAMSRSAAPQLQEVSRALDPLFNKLDDVDELLYVLGWIFRLVQTTERRSPRQAGPGGPRPDQRHGGPNRGGFQGRPGPRR